MTLKISDAHMALEMGGQVIAVAKVAGDGRWQVNNWPELLDRNQAITALTVTELLERGYPSEHPVVAALRDEITRSGSSALGPSTAKYAQTGAAPPNPSTQAR
jgi:hypothetical protein